MSIKRLVAINFLLGLLLFLVVVRLFYWQVIRRVRLQQLAQSQHQMVVETPANRGKILSDDGYVMVSNQNAYLVYAYMPDIKDNPTDIANKVGSWLIKTDLDQMATTSGVLVEIDTKNYVASIEAKLTQIETSWVSLHKKVLESTKKEIEKLRVGGIGFDAYSIRFYPEASMAAKLLGYVGTDALGKPKGYNGLEGKYNFELAGRDGIRLSEKDALGKPIVTGEFSDIKSRDGRTLKTHLNRKLQYLVENELELGVNKYQAVEGEVIIVDPYTGGIMAMASLPKFDPLKYSLYDMSWFKNSSISELYEPGSTFKTLVMAAAINENAITPETRCDEMCDGPITIGKYTIKTWNNRYNGAITMTEVLEKSDNTGMVFAANKLGKEKLVAYLKKFGLNELSNIDLEGEITGKLKNKWGDIDVATASFGQGITLNTVQMLMAVSTIANGGLLMEPHVVDKVIDNIKESVIKPKIVRRVISADTAKTVTQMMVASAKYGDAKWAVPQELNIAGKTGTAQVAILGYYDKEKTVASFVGFAPADRPKYAMIVKLREPKISIWASETAAPLWFKIAKELNNINW